MQNFEELVRLDDTASSRSSAWNTVVQFSVYHGPHAFLTFKDGVCTFDKGRNGRANFVLFYSSPAHFNKALDGKAQPIPLRGFMKLGFLSREFGPVADRLGYYLKPAPESFGDPAFVKTNTILTLQTAAFAVAELAALEPESMHLASHMGEGVLQIEVQPDGPFVALTAANGSISAAKRRAERPRSVMTFRSLEVASDLLCGRTDSFTTVARGDVTIRGYIPLADNANMIMDRVRRYLD